MYNTIFTIALTMIILAWVIALFILLTALRSGKGLVSLLKKRKRAGFIPSAQDPTVFPLYIDLPDHPSPD